LHYITNVNDKLNHAHFDDLFIISHSSFIFGKVTDKYVTYQKPLHYFSFSLLKSYCFVIKKAIFHFSSKKRKIV